ncbi:hypothetical protein [Corallococcus caeni]|uniref:hypothetical protein n=1 Tax=Corallococcus caeni TaxID=3082388 RepID=UPI0030C65C85
MGLWLCVLGGMAACPDVHRPGGKLDRAARKDVLDRLSNQECHSDEFRRECAESGIPLEECLEDCEE